MLYSSIAFAALLTIAAATAIPKLPQVDPVTKRAENTWDPNGNVKLIFSKETVNIGGLSMDEIHGSLAGACHEEGLCETSPIELKAQRVKGTKVSNIKITLNPDGSYPTWIRNGLVDTLYAAAKHISVCTPGSFVDSCPGVTAMAYCPRRKIEFVNCEIPKFWGINYQDKDSANAAPPSITLDTDVEVVDADLCTPILTALGALAGAVNGPAGSAFSLIGLACQ